MKAFLRRVATRLRFDLLPRLLAAWPATVVRPLAVPLATVRWLAQPGPRRAAGPVLRALGRPATPWARWRFAWQTAYHSEASYLLDLQVDKLSDAWIARHVRWDVPPPPGGAILLAPHQEYGRFANWWLHLRGYPVGLIADENRATWDRNHPDHARQRAAHGDRGRYYAGRWRFWERVYDGNLFRSPEDTRAALRFLQAGGYLVVKPDGYRHANHPRWEAADLLGRAIPVAPGPAWLARRSGKPILPYVAIPDRHGWRVVIGEPVEPTQRGVATALATCLRHSPETFHGLRWLAWSQSPAWGAAPSLLEEAMDRGVKVHAR